MRESEDMIKVAKNEYDEFINYCLMFYGAGAIYGKTGFANREQITAATNIYLTRGDDKFFCDIGEGPEHRWGGGDTVDREIVADILMNEFNIELY